MDDIFRSVVVLYSAAKQLRVTAFLLTTTTDNSILCKMTISFQTKHLLLWKLPSRDINTIKHILDILGRSVSCLLSPIEAFQKLEYSVMQEERRKPKYYFGNLIDSIPHKYMILFLVKENQTFNETNFVQEITCLC